MAKSIMASMLNIKMLADEICMARTGNPCVSLTNVENIEIDGIDRKDHPKYVDAYIASAKWKHSGKDLTPNECAELTENNYDYINQQCNENAFSE